MNHKTTIFKIGGSILEDFENVSSTISQLSYLYEKDIIQKIIIIPGGGSFANFIRKIYDDLKFTDELAHWMSIISMNYNGIELGKRFPKIEAFEDYRRLKDTDKTFSIFLPYQFLKNNDKLPHNWQVTSDSITLFLARSFGVNECFLVKDVDGIMDEKTQVIKEISTREFRKLKEFGKLLRLKNSDDELKNQSRPIDPYLLTLIEKWDFSCVILNGTSGSHRIIDFFDASKSLQEKIFTRII
ncbi:MAG: hypothetical protein KGD58_13685 [Candidatus Lokiarchaeota archaeon]|nr:hypothetical protein [Candidatus Lokiarchaeota archaeon]